MKSWLQENKIETYSIYIERKSVVAERFVRTLKKDAYIGKLDETVHE